MMQSIIHKRIKSLCAIRRKTTRQRAQGKFIFDKSRAMIDSGMFDAGLVTQLSDLHLWTPNFHYDRLSDLTTNIIRSVLVGYTYLQYRNWGLPLPAVCHHRAPTWDTRTHRWVLMDCPHFLSGRFPTLLVPKAFVGRYMLSSPGELLQKYTLRYRQQEHLDERSDYCHLKVRKNGDEVLTPPTKRELYGLEVKGQPAKEYLRHIGTAHPNMVRELHGPGVKFCVSVFRQSQEWRWKAGRILV